MNHSHAHCAQAVVTEQTGVRIDLDRRRRPAVESRAPSRRRSPARGTASEGSLRNQTSRKRRARSTELRCASRLIVMIKRCSTWRCWVRIHRSRLAARASANSRPLSGRAGYRDLQAALAGMRGSHRDAGRVGASNVARRHIIERWCCTCEARTESASRRQRHSIRNARPEIGFQQPLLKQPLLTLCCPYADKQRYTRPIRSGVDLPF